MDDEKNEQAEPCEGIRQARETDKEIKEIFKLMSIISSDNNVNAANLKHLTSVYKELATANSLTHYKLFSRTEDLKINLKGIETKHSEHVKHGTQEGTNKQNRYTLLVSITAIGISLIAVVVGAIQAGVFR